MASFFALYVVMFFVVQTFSREECLVQNLKGVLLTKHGVTLRAHTRQTFASTTFVQCSLRCQQKDWCISINYEYGTPYHKGVCELNDYGVDEEGDFPRERFKERPGYLYTQLRPADFGCSNHRCYNGGKCVINCTTLVAECRCPQGTKGQRCEENIDDCASNPCVNNGTCTDSINTYTCSCVPGYRGINCECDIDECFSNPCQNGGTCTDGINSYFCLCAPGYDGTHCENDIDECASNPCLNGGTCQDRANGYQCICVSPYTGKQCLFNDRDDK